VTRRRFTATQRFCGAPGASDSGVAPFATRASLTAYPRQTRLGATRSPALALAIANRWLKVAVALVVLALPIAGRLWAAA